MFLQSCFFVSFHAGSHSIILESIFFLGFHNNIHSFSAPPKICSCLLSCECWCSPNFLLRYRTLFIYRISEYLLYPQHLNHFLGTENSWVRFLETWYPNSDLATSCLLDISRNFNSLSPKLNGHLIIFFPCASAQAGFSSYVPCLGSFLTASSARERTIYICVYISVFRIHVYYYTCPCVYLDVHLWTWAITMMMMIKLTLIGYWCERHYAKHFTWIIIFIFTISWLGMCKYGLWIL